MMNRQPIIRWTPFLLLLVADLLAIRPAQAQRGAAAAGGASANSDGPTVSRGQTYYPYGSNNEYGGFGGGVPIVRFSRSGSSFGAMQRHASSGLATPNPTLPYRTNRFFEPGDGWRYPLYYNPATASFFYYPLPR